MRFFEVEHPWLIPLWRRVLVVLACLAWAAVEWAASSPVWGVIALGFAGYAGWSLLLNFDVARARGKP